MKKSISLIMVLCLLSAFSAALAAPDTEEDDYQGLTQVGTALQDGSGGYLLPLRPVWEASGYTVVWDGATKTIHIQANGMDAFIFTVGSSYMEATGRIILAGYEKGAELGGPVVIINDSAYAPAAAMYDCIAAKIDPETLTIYMDVSVLYKVYDGKNPLSKEELQAATSLTILNVESLDFLRDATKLTRLKVGDSNDLDMGEYAETVSGDIRVLGELPNLVSVYLNNTKVSGDIGSLSSLIKLEELYLNDTKVSGDLDGLKKLSNLKVMFLSVDTITGDLSALSGMSALDTITLTGNGITGDLSALRGLSDLDYIGLAFTPKVTGDLNDLKGLKLTGVSLVDTDVTVDLSVFSAFPDLIYFGLRSSKVTGDISVFSGHTKLIQFFLLCPNVSGDISALSKLTNLVHVYVNSPGVSGDIGAFSGHTMLMFLNLAGTSVSGDIGALKSLVNLSSLNLSDTDVSGDIGALSGLTNLMTINVTGTKVTGSTESEAG